MATRGDHGKRETAIDTKCIKEAKVRQKRKAREPSPGYLSRAARFADRIRSSLACACGGIPYPTTTSVTDWSSHPFPSLKHRESSSHNSPTRPRAHCDDQERLVTSVQCPFLRQNLPLSPSFVPLLPQTSDCVTSFSQPFSSISLFLSPSISVALPFPSFSLYITPRRGIESSRLSCQACMYTYRIHANIYAATCAWMCARLVDNCGVNKVERGGWKTHAGRVRLFESHAGYSRAYDGDRGILKFFFLFLFHFVRFFYFYSLTSDVLGLSHIISSLVCSVRN